MSPPGKALGGTGDMAVSEEKISDLCQTTEFVIENDH
jgi:hypothetical protein